MHYPHHHGGMPQPGGHYSTLGGHNNSFGGYYHNLHNARAAATAAGQPPTAAAAAGRPKAPMHDESNKTMATSTTDVSCMRSLQPLMSVDLSIDLATVRAEINNCKRRYQQEVWNLLCNKAMAAEGQGQSAGSWKRSGGGGGGGGQTTDRDEESRSVAGSGAGATKRPGGADSGRTEEYATEEDENGEEYAEGYDSTEDNENNKSAALRRRRRRQQLQQQQRTPASTTGASRRRQKSVDDWNNWNNSSRQLLPVVGFSDQLPMPAPVQPLPLHHPACPKLRQQRPGHQQASDVMSFSISSSRRQQVNKPQPQPPDNDELFLGGRRDGEAEAVDGNLNESDDDEDELLLDDDFFEVADNDSCDSSIVGHDGGDRRPFVPMFCGTWGSAAVPRRRPPSHQQQQRRQKPVRQKQREGMTRE